MVGLSTLIIILLPYIIDSSQSYSECVNGTHSCFVNYTGDEDGQLDSEQVIDLKQKLIQVYNFQKNHDEHIITDIGHILDNSVDGECMLA